MPKLPWQTPSVDADRAELVLDVYQPTQTDPLKDLVSNDLKSGLNRRFLPAFSGFQAYAYWIAHNIARQRMSDAGAGVIGMIEGAPLDSPAMHKPFFQPPDRIRLNKTADLIVATTLDVSMEQVQGALDEGRRQRFLHGLACALQAEAKSLFRPNVDQVTPKETQPEAFSANTRAYQAYLSIEGTMSAMAQFAEGRFQTTVCAKVGLNAENEPTIYETRLAPSPTSGDDIVALDPHAEFDTEAPAGRRGIATNPMIDSFISEGDHPGWFLISEEAKKPMYQLLIERDEEPEARP